MNYLIWVGSQITPQGILLGFIAGAVLAWFARGDWEGIEEDEGSPGEAK